MSDAREEEMRNKKREWFGYGILKADEGLFLSLAQGTVVNFGDTQIEYGIFYTRRKIECKLYS